MYTYKSSGELSNICIVDNDPEGWALGTSVDWTIITAVVRALDPVKVAVKSYSGNCGSAPVVSALLC